MKKIFFLLFLSLAYTVQAQFNAIHYQRKDIFEKLPITSDDIIFLGNSITHGGKWTELFDNIHVKNRGISGNTTDAVLDRLDTIISGTPAKIFLLIGINDLGQGQSVNYVFNNIKTIVERIKTNSPQTQVYVQSVLPVNNNFSKFPSHCSKGSEIMELNSKLSTAVGTWGGTYIDVYSGLKNTTDEQLNSIYTNDGLHLLGNGYIKWVSLIKTFVEE